MRDSRVARSFWRNTGGNTVILFALSLPVLLGAGGAALDYTAFAAQDDRLQSAADAAALAAAREFQIGTPDAARTQAVAESVARARLQGEAGAAITLTSSVLQEKNGVKITVVQPRRANIMQIFGIDPGSANVVSTARLVGQRRICIMAFEPTEKEAVQVDSEAKITAPTCDVNSKSKSTEGIMIKSSGGIDALLTCSEGGISAKGTVKGSKQTDCPTPKNPLADRKVPNIDAMACDHSNNFEPNGNKSSYSAGNRYKVRPGVYCKGLKIPGDWFVEFEAGEYYIKGDKFEIAGKTNVTGDGVVFIFGGEKSMMDFDKEATLSLFGRKIGDYSGILFYDTYNLVGTKSASVKKHVIKSVATDLVGTAYLPESELHVDLDAKVSGGSAWTVILAKAVRLGSKSEMVLNTRYNDYPYVPVPAGLSGQGQSVRLSE